MDRDFLDAVKSLTTAVNNFLQADDGCDDHRIENMSATVANILSKARKIPALKNWAENLGEYYELE